MSDQTPDHVLFKTGMASLCSECMGVILIREPAVLRRNSRPPEPMHRECADAAGIAYVPAAGFVEPTDEELARMEEQRVWHDRWRGPNDRPLGRPAAVRGAEIRRRVPSKLGRAGAPHPPARPT